MRAWVEDVIVDSTVRGRGVGAKFWVAPVALAWNSGFSPRELNEIRRLIIAHEAVIIEAWHEHCGTDGLQNSPR